MDPLRLVEDRVGDVQSWPTYILLHMFVEEPNARTVSVRCLCAGLVTHQRSSRDCGVSEFDRAAWITRSPVWTVVP
jgi:hypothetical protein